MQAVTIARSNSVSIEYKNAEEQREHERRAAAYRQYLGAKSYSRTGRREGNLRMTFVAEIPADEVKALRASWEDVPMTRDSFHRRPYYRDAHGSLCKVFPRL